MSQAAPILEWEVDDAAPTRVKNDPPPSALEATRPWRQDASGVRASHLADFSARELESTLVFPLERRLPPSFAFRQVTAAPVMAPPPAPAVAPKPQKSRAFALSVATFSVMAVVLALALPWASSFLR